MPVWLSELEDQEVTLGDALLYRIGLEEQPGMSLTFNLGSAVDFASFDGDGDFFRVHATLIE